MAWIDDVYRERERLADQAQPVQPPPIPTSLEADRRHLFGPEVGAIVPALQALLSGVFFGLPALILAWVTARPDPWRWGAGVFALAMAATWAAGLQRHRALTKPLGVLEWLERVTGRDLNSDGTVGPAVIEPKIIKLEITKPTDGGTSTAMIDLPIGADALQALAAGLVAGAPFSEVEWSGAGKPLSRSEFRAVRQALLDRGLAAWASEKDRRQGLHLTPEGVTVFTSIAGAPLPRLRPPTA